jgi:putative two-component system response regulator
MEISVMKTNILIVDDSKADLMRAAAVLSQDYRVSTVDSAALGYAFLAGCTPDLILIDIQMPEISGFEMMEALQGNEDWRKIPVLFLTEDLSPEIEEKCFFAGALDFIPKPFVPALLKRRVEKTLELLKENEAEAIFVFSDKRAVMSKGLFETFTLTDNGFTVSEYEA